MGERSEFKTGRIFRPGAILSLEGERCSVNYTIVAGVVEETLGHHIVARRSAGDRVPRVSSGVAEFTTRAVTVVRVELIDG